MCDWPPHLVPKEEALKDKISLYIIVNDVMTHNHCLDNPRVSFARLRRCQIVLKALLDYKGVKQCHMLIYFKALILQNDKLSMLVHLRREKIYFVSDT